MNPELSELIRKRVRARYGRVAVAGGGECGCGPACCDTPARDADAHVHELGYSWEDIRATPEGANMGLGCGNPQIVGALKPGETVVDLGSGGGFDCFLAAGRVGRSGQVIGVDMTPEMVVKARTLALEGGFRNVEFRLGEIESLPVADGVADVVISNCVINLATDKPRVFRQAFRVLKPGGRLAVSDMIALAPIPAALLEDPDLYTGCVSGASTATDIAAMLEAAGFVDVSITASETDQNRCAPASSTAAVNHVRSATIQAAKPIEGSTRVAVPATSAPPEAHAMTNTTATKAALEIWQNHRNRLRGYIIKRVRKTDVADDILQDVFIKLHMGLPSLESQYSITAWLYRVTANAIVDHYRAQRPCDELPEEVAEPDPDHAAEEVAALATCLQPLLREIPIKYRTAVELADLDGLTQNEVAHRLGLSLSGAKSRIQRGRDRLRERLLDCCRVEVAKNGIVGYESRRRRPPCGCR